LEYDGTTYFRDLVYGCMLNNPSSPSGQDYWYGMESSANFDIANFMPDDFTACNWMEDWMYVWGDFAVGSDGAIYECWDMEYCNYEPTSDMGYWGWGEADLYSTSDIDSYDATTCVAHKNFVNMGAAYPEGLPYRTGDMLYGTFYGASDTWAVCAEGITCRVTAAAEDGATAVTDAQSCTDAVVGYLSWTTPTANLCGHLRATLADGTNGTAQDFGVWHTFFDGSTDAVIDAYW
jgi:hypothetical protein